MNLFAVRNVLGVCTLAFLLAGCAGAWNDAANGTQPLSASGVASAAPSAENGFANLYTFDVPTDGAQPAGPLVVIGDKLYGTTLAGGATSRGTVFEITTSGVERVVYSFGTSGISYKDGDNPHYLIAQGNVLYGSTLYGGSGGDGTVFEVSLSGKERILNNFKANINGANPGPLVGMNGVIYGVAQDGRFGNGLIFEITPAGEEHAVYLFKGGTDGSMPVSLVAVHNELYGTTHAGGSSDRGTVFSLDPSGKEHVIYNFGLDSGSAVGRLIYADGKLYGATAQGGIFALSTSGEERLVCGTVTGTITYLNGALYVADDAGDGSIYKVSSGQATKLHTFYRTDGGRYPSSPLLPLDDVLYGTTSESVHGSGTFYRIAP